MEIKNIKKTTPNILKPSQVSKKIIAKSPKSRSSSEWFDYSGKYRDENVAEYNEKKNEFLSVVRAYNRMNTETLTCRKIRLHGDYEKMLNLDFLKENKEHDGKEDCLPLCCCPQCTPNKTGRLLRKRSLRAMSYVEEPKTSVCSIEPWFKRYLVLNKFIWAARTVIIQNRLLKVLDKLKILTWEDIEKIEKAGTKKRAEDYHCHPVFLKFL